MEEVSLYLVVAVAVVLVGILVAGWFAAKNSKSSKVMNSPAQQIESLPYRPAVSEEAIQLVESAIRLWQLEAKQAKSTSKLGAYEANEATSLRELLKSSDASYFDPTGQHYSPANYLEVVSHQDGVDLNTHGLSVVVADSPAVIHRGAIVRKAAVKVYAK